MTCLILLMVLDQMKENVWQNAILLLWKKTARTKATCPLVIRLIKTINHQQQDHKSKWHQHHKSKWHQHPSQL